MTICLQLRRGRSDVPELGNSRLTWEYESVAHLASEVGGAPAQHPSRKSSR